jgi:hypothetical protein
MKSALQKGGRFLVSMIRGGRQQLLTLTLQVCAAKIRCNIVFGERLIIKTAGGRGKEGFPISA